MTDDQHRVRLTAADAIANLRTVLELCEAGKLSCSQKTRRPSAAAVEEVEAHLIDGDFYAGDAIASFAWPLLMQAGGLAQLEGTRLRLTPAGRAAVSMPPAETLRHLWQNWLTHAVIDEFSRIDTIKGQGIRHVLTAPKVRRGVVHEALRTCIPGEWIAVDELFAHMGELGLSPTIPRSARALSKLYLVNPHYGSFGYPEHQGWELLEGRYTLAVLFEYAATLGFIDVDYTDAEGAREDFHDNWGGDVVDTLSRYDGLRAIRLNDLGAYAMDLKPSYDPPPPPPTRPGVLNVLPNLDIVILGDFHPADRLHLSTFAHQTNDHVWTVSTDSLLASVDSGRELADVTRFLRQHCQRELPNTLVTLINDVQRRAGFLTDLGQARVIECADAATAALIANDRQLRALCRSIGDKYLVVPLDRELKFRTALRKLGYVAPTRHY